MPRPNTVKPPPGVQVNRGHPLAAGLKCLLTFSQGAGSPIDIVRNRVAARSGSPGWAVDRGGPAGNLPDATSWWDLGANDAFVPTQRVTVLMIRRKTDAILRSCSAFGVQDAGNFGTRCGAHCPLNDGNTYWDFGGISAGTSRVTVGSSPSSGFQMWAFVAGGRGMAVWLNGALLNSHASGITRTSSTANYLVGAGNGINNSDLANFDLFAVLDAEWTGAEVRQWTADPYAMLLPPQPVLGRAALVLVQLASPVSDVSAGGWTPIPATPPTLYDKIDEASADDADYIMSREIPLGDAAEVRLSALGAPVSTDGHTVRVRLRKRLDRHRFAHARRPDRRLGRGRRHPDAHGGRRDHRP
jgi:hypothetical protein